MKSIPVLILLLASPASAGCEKSSSHAIPTPVLKAPADNSQTIVFHPSLSWENAFDRSMTVAIQIASDDRFSQIADADRVHSVSDWYVPAKRLEPGTYHWRARFEKDSGEAGAWSERRAFRIIEPETTLRVTPEMPLEAIRAIAIQAAAASSARIIFEKAEYRINPGYQRALFEWRDADNIIVDGGGSRIILQEPSAQLWSAGACRNILIGNFSAEYEARPHTTATVTATDSKAGTLDARFVDGFSDALYPRTVNQMFCYVQDPEDQRRLHIDRPGHLYLDPAKTTKSADGMLRYFLSDKREFLLLERLRPGDQLVVCYRRWPLSYVHRCDDVTLHDITLTRSEGVFFIGGGNSDMKFLRLNTPSEKGVFPSPAGWVTGNDRHGPWIEDCFFEAIADDGPNITGNAYQIDAVDGRALDLKAHVGWQNPVWRAGDRLVFWNPIDGLPLFETTVAEALTTPVEIRKGSQRVRIADPPRGLAPGSDPATHTQVHNLSCQNDGFVARNNRLVGGRRFGFNVKANNTLIENNHFEGLASSAIYLENAPTFGEGLACERAVIQGNTVLDCGGTLNSSKRRRASGIFVNLWKFPSKGNFTTTWQGHRDILIRNNTIIDWEASAIAVDNAQDAVIHGNTIGNRSKSGFLTPNNTAILIGTDTTGVNAGPNEISDSREFIRQSNESLK
jgi:hypothetical protein